MLRHILFDVKDMCKIWRLLVKLYSLNSNLISMLIEWFKQISISISVRSVLCCSFKSRFFNFIENISDSIYCIWMCRVCMCLVWLTLKNGFGFICFDFLPLSENISTEILLMFSLLPSKSCHQQFIFLLVSLFFALIDFLINKWSRISMSFC